VVCATLGKNVRWLRVRIFALGGGIIGLAGSMHGFYYQYIEPRQFSNIVLAYGFMAVIAGGRGAHAGAIFGAAAEMALLEGSRFVTALVPVLDSDQRAAMRIAAKINAGGGVLGRKLELLIEDSESSAAVAANLSHKFINVHKAQALVGYWGTPEGMSSRPIAIQNKVVLMVSSAANAITEGDTQGYVWRFQLKATDWGTVISRATLNKLGFKSVGVMGLQN